MYLQIWYPKDDTKIRSWKELIYLINNTFIIVQLIISLSVCILCIQLVHEVGRKPRPTCTDMVRYVTLWMSSLGLESSDSHYDFKPALLLTGKAGSVVLAENTWRSLCHHARRSHHTAESFSNTFHDMCFRRAHQIIVHFVSILLSTKLGTLMAACHQIWKKVWRVIPESPVSILVLCSEVAVTSTCVHKIYPTRQLALCIDALTQLPTLCSCMAYIHYAGWPPVYVCLCMASLGEHHHGV